MTCNQDKLLEKIRLTVITDRKRLPDQNLLAAAEKAFSGGVRCMQLREKDLSAKELLAYALPLKKLAESFAALLIVNSLVEVALEAHADGVHLPEDGPSAKEIKEKHPGLLVGVSTHSLEKAQQAQADGADYISFSPVFETASKKAYGAPQGLDKLKDVTESVSIPVLALGGIKKDRVSAVLSHGAYGIALISGIWDSTHIKNESSEYIKLFKETPDEPIRLRK